MRIRVILGEVTELNFNAIVMRIIPLKEINTMQVDKHLELLGLRVKDSVTGFKGVVTSISFDLYGCVQAIVQPETNKEGEIPDSGWFDVTRLITIKQAPVMEQPNFEKGYIAEGRKGCDVNKPLR